jgi:hypothetical protein
MEFINPWIVEGAFVRPKGMTKNSVFHGDASPRVGVVGDVSLTSQGRGDSRGDVSPRPLFGET